MQRPSSVLRLPVRLEADAQREALPLPRTLRLLEKHPLRRLKRAVEKALGVQAAEALRMQYRAASRLWKMAVSWVRSQLPLPMRPSGSAASAPGGGWTRGGIAGLVTAIPAALAGLGEATRRGVKSVRSRMAEKDAEVDAARSETDEAMQALDEVKQAHPRAVKTATDRARRPRLRQAFVRREVQVNGAAETAGSALG